MSKKRLGSGMQGPTGFSTFSIESLIAPSQPRVPSPLHTGRLMGVPGTARAVEGFIPPHIACSLAGAGLRLSPEMSIFLRPVATALPDHATRTLFGQNYAQLVNVASSGLLSHHSPTGQAMPGGSLRPWDVAPTDCHHGMDKTTDSATKGRTRQPHERSPGRSLVVRL